MSNMFSSHDGVKLCIFDLDGTLVNTIRDLGESVSYALEQMGLPTRTMQEYTDFVGNGTLLLVKRSLPDKLSGDEAAIAKAHELFSDYYSKHYADHSAVYSGMAETVAALKERGVKLCVLTNKPDRFAKEIISGLFDADSFDWVFGSRENVPKKPDPTAELEIMALEGVQKENTVHIGDSDVDVYTAHNAGIKCIGCTWGFRSEQSLEDAKADYIAHRPADILDILGIAHA